MRLYHLIVGSQWTGTCNEYVRTPYDDHTYVQVHNQRDTRKILSGAESSISTGGSAGWAGWVCQDILKSPHPKYAY